MTLKNSWDAGSRAFAPALAQPTVPFYLLPYCLFARLLLGTYEIVFPFTSIAFLHLIDFYISGLNLFSLRKRRGYVIPQAFSPEVPPSIFRSPWTWLLCLACRLFRGLPVAPALLYWAYWPGLGAHEPPLPKEGLSRCCCPALNALANHSVLPRDGRRLTPHRVAAACSRTYNLSPTVSYALLAPFAHLWRHRGYFDLEDIGAPMHHDGALTREDDNSAFALPTVVATRGRPSERLLSIYFPRSVKTLSIVKHARILGHRRQASRKANGGYYMSPAQAIWSSFKSALLHASIGPSQKNGELYFPPLSEFEGRTDPVLAVSRFLGANESGWEMIPSGWEPATRSRWGTTLFHLDFLTLLIELTAGSWSTLPRALTDFKGSETVKGWNANLGECRNSADPNGLGLGLEAAA